jgi:hypothetical protein
MKKFLLLILLFTLIISERSIESDFNNIEELFSNSNEIDNYEPDTLARAPSRGTARAPPSRGTAKAPPSRGTAKSPPSRGTAKAPPSRGTAKAPPSRETAKAPPSRGTAKAPPSRGTAKAPSRGTVNTNTRKPVRYTKGPYKVSSTLFIKSTTCRTGYRLLNLKISTILGVFTRKACVYDKNGEYYLLEDKTYPYNENQAISSSVSNQQSVQNQIMSSSTIQKFSFALFFVIFLFF